MSGLLGIWNSQMPAPWQAMLTDLDCLGSDGSGEWHNQEIGLSLGRTQFFNTAESCQESPVVEYDGCVLVWDGRLDARESLLSGRSVVTDAQLVIEAYRRWGSYCIQNLIGEFAFILWDVSQDLLLVGCDVTGSRSLAYFWDGETLLLASRVLTLLLHPQVRAQLEPVYIAHSLCNTSAHPPGLTAFADIKRVLPGHALLLKSGRLSHSRIANFASPGIYDRQESPDLYYEKFWHILNQSVQDRLRSDRQPYVTLSGGLDSTTVAIALLNQLPSVDAISMVTDIYPEFDEGEAIAAFLDHYPQVKWHPLNCDDAWAMTEPWSQLPLIDDPFITCILPSNLRTMQMAQKLGLGVEFSGTWGDEFCYVLSGDYLKAGDWRPLWRSLSSSPRLHSNLWWQFVLPNLPRSWQAKWINAKMSPAEANLPAWLSSPYRRSPDISLAYQQSIQSGLASQTRQSALDNIIQGAIAVGAQNLYRLLASSYQVESVSPMRDRRLIEFANGLHPSLQTDPTYYKIFLRQANRGRLPETVRLRPKNNYFDPLKYLGLGKSEQPLSILEHASHDPLLQELLDLEELKSQVDDYRVKFQEFYVMGEGFYDEWGNHLLAVLTFMQWFARVKKDYLDVRQDRVSLGIRVEI
jgi:asparagine synthase (glutamine-hydrolysing)